MIEDRIKKAEERVQEASHIPETAKEELLKLLPTLKDEVGALAESHQEDAQSIAGFIDASTHEATRTEKRPKLVDASLQGLTASVENFEASHPKLVETVNQFAVVLSNMGL